MKHFKELTAADLISVKADEEFTYVNAAGHYRKGVVSKDWVMTPIGLSCKTLAAAQKQKRKD